MTALAVFAGVSLFVAGSTWGLLRLSRHSEKHRILEAAVPPEVRKRFWRYTFWGTRVMLSVTIIVLIAAAINRRFTPWMAWVTVGAVAANYLSKVVIWRWYRRARRAYISPTESPEGP